MPFLAFFTFSLNEIIRRKMQSLVAYFTNLLVLSVRYSVCGKKGKTATPSRRLQNQKVRPPYPTDGQTPLQRHQYQRLCSYLLAE